MIRLFSESNFAILIYLWERSVEATHHFLLQEDFDFYKTIVPNYFPNIKLFVYEEEESIKGFMGVSDDEIELLFVDPQYIGQGIGKQLLKYAIDELKLKKVDVNEHNDDDLGSISILVLG